MMTAFADVLHRLVDNSPGFAGPDAIQAHKDITDELGGDRHLTVPSPEDEKQATDEKAARRAELERELAALDDGHEDAPADSEPVPVADQRAAGVPPDQTVTIADQRAGTPPPEV